MKTWGKWLRYSLLAGTGVVIVFLWFPYQWLGERLWDVVHQLHPADVIVVLFGNGDGTNEGLGPESQRRARYGVKLLQDGLADKIIFSGGYPDGSDLMADFARQLGVPAEEIIVENRSYDTLSNWEYSTEIMRAHDWRSALLVSSVFHLTRTLQQIEPHEITIYPAAVPYSACKPPYTRRQLRSSFRHNVGAYLLYAVAGERYYQSVVEYIRLQRT